ncbi:hypothetical protein [Piscinibacter sp. HJYY11]|uniref:hypothetical protein n=1 Tax=Piscinibacter sp. HJYY11 TaxID=2801333 RepID=UPI00191E037B|nr:hypothetical protein [Piscinibacter sp. HJYY11]MBL0730270.1 hypothetical protein [Piscinibacter sp. HJYY11]
MRLFATLTFALTALVAASPSAVAQTPQRVFISGHSLIDQPVPDYLARIAASLGPPLQWNRQYLVGSAIRYRTQGRGRETGWAGYAIGQNREGEGLNVVEELRKPRTTDGQPYDTLVITEQHGVLDSIVMHDTVRHLRHYHERFITGNAKGQTWFYEPWLGVTDKNDPSRWLAYERSAAPMWQCVVTRINTSLAAEGRADRIQSLPASLALATLVERATRGQVPELAAGSTRATLDRLFHDQVHLTSLGAYYMALSVYAATFGRTPVGAWAPEQVTPALAAALQRVAWEAVSAERAARKPLPLEQCGPYLKQLAPTYFDYMRDDYWAHQEQSLRQTYRRLRHEINWRWRLWDVFDDDPFRYDAATDKSYWLPAP